MTATRPPRRRFCRAVRAASWKRAAEDRDCGAAAFATIATHHGHHLTVEQARELVQTDRTGTSMVHICQAGRAIGFDARGAIGTYAGLAKVATPAIVHLEGGDGHFLVLTKWGERSVRVIDPSVGPLRMSRKDLEEQWSGYLVEFVPTDALESKAPDVVPGRIIRKTVRSSARTVALCVVLMAAGTGLGILSAGFLADAIGLIGGGADRSDDIGRAAASLAALALIVGLSQFVRMVLITRAGMRWQTELGHRFLKQIAQLPSSDFEERCVVAFVGRSGEIDMARDAVFNSAVGAGADAIVVGAAIGICAFVAPALAALLVASVVLFLVIALVGRRLGALAAFQATRRNYEYVSRIVDSYNEVATVKLYNADEEVSSELLERFDRNAEAQRREALVASVPAVLANTLATIVLVGVLGIAAIAAANGQATVADVLVAFGCAMVFLAVMPEMPGYLVNLGQAAITLERVEEVRLKPAERNLELPERDLSGQGELVLDHVSFHYRPEYPVLHDVSVTIAPGEVVAFVGETGSGKTSIARLLTRLRIPAGGTISLDGIDYDELSPRQVRDQVTAVFQDSKLLQRTIRENLTLGRDATDEEIIEALAAAQAVSVVQGLRLGLDANAARAGATLSAGQLQRLALARALLRNPPVLILDEATANLDSRTERELLEAVLTHRKGRTTIMIAHRLTAVQRADRVVVLADGRVVQDGAPSELMAVDGQFRRLFEDQFADRFADGLQQPAPTS